MKADIKVAKSPIDRAEPVSMMEPLLLSESARQKSTLMDKAFELTQLSASFRSSLPPALLASLAGMIRAMNCYYSNLIEGYDTHPVDIERALKSDYSQDSKKRDLQLEAKAHIEVQEWIDKGSLPYAVAVSTDGIREIHRRFCEGLPDDLLWIEHPDTKEKIKLVPGELRMLDIKVGQHYAVSPGAVPRFIERFAAAYLNIGKAESVLAVAAAHHRLLWIHPFLDGNGRVARLVSHAMLLDTLQTGGVWSVARGLARNVGEYKRLLAACDQERRNDLDGRGHLSQDALADFTGFFLNVAIDQVKFMESLMQPARLHHRIQIWAEEEIRLGELPGKADKILSAVLYRGEIARGEAEHITNVGERQARRIIAALLKRGVLRADGVRAPLRLAFPASLAHRWMPGLFPEKTS